MSTTGLGLQRSTARRRLTGDVRARQLAWWMVLASVLMSVVLVLWASPQQALACESPENRACIEEQPLPAGLGEGSSGPLLYHEGKGVQQTPKVYVIFWGTNFEKTKEGEEVHSMLLKLFEGMTTTNKGWEGILTQYFDSTGGPTGRVGSSVTTTSWIDKSVTAPSNLTEAKVEEEVGNAIATNKWTIESSAQFVVTTAPGSTYEETFRPRACAYHKYTSSNAIYDFVPYQGDKRYIENKCIEIVFPKKNPIYKTSKSASHEFAEAATDPFATEIALNEWYTEGVEDLEIGDICQSLEVKRTTQRGVGSGDL